MAKAKQKKTSTKAVAKSKAGAKTAAKLHFLYMLTTISWLSSALYCDISGLLDDLYGQNPFSLSCSPCRSDFQPK